MPEELPTLPPELLGASVFVLRLCGKTEGAAIANWKCKTIADVAAHYPEASTYHQRKIKTAFERMARLYTPVNELDFSVAGLNAACRAGYKTAGELADALSGAGGSDIVEKLCKHISLSDVEKLRKHLGDDFPEAAAEAVQSRFNKFQGDNL